jgi:hypothetical protein
MEWWSNGVTENKRSITRMRKRKRKRTNTALCRFVLLACREEESRPNLRALRVSAVNLLVSWVYDPPKPRSADSRA